MGGPQQPSSKKGAVKSEIERDPRNSQNVCGRKDNGRTEMGKNWTKGKGLTEEVWKTTPNRQRGKHNRNTNYPEEVHERRERTRDGTNLRRVCGKMKMKKTGRKEGEKKQNGNTLRTRAGNRGGSVLRRGKN